MDDVEQWALSRRDFLKLSAAAAGALAMGREQGGGRGKEWGDVAMEWEKVIDYNYPERGETVDVLARRIQGSLDRLGFSGLPTPVLGSGWWLYRDLKGMVEKYYRAKADVEQGKEDTSLMAQDIIRRGKGAVYSYFLPPGEDGQTTHTGVKVLQNREPDTIIIGEPVKVEEAQEAYGEYFRQVVRYVQAERGFDPRNLPIPGVAIRRAKEGEIAAGFVTTDWVPGSNVIRVLYREAKFEHQLMVGQGFDFLTRDLPVHEITHLLWPTQGGENIAHQLSVREIFKSYATVLDVLDKKRDFLKEQLGGTIDLYREKSEVSRNLYRQVARWVETNLGSFGVEVTGAVKGAIKENSVEWNKQWGEDEVGLGKWFLDQYWGDGEIKKAMGGKFDKEVFFGHFFYHELTAFVVESVIAGRLGFVNDPDFVKMTDAILALGRNGATAEGLRLAMGMLERSCGLSGFRPILKDEIVTGGKEPRRQGWEVLGCEVGLGGVGVGLSAKWLYEQIRREAGNKIFSVPGLEELERKRVIDKGKFHREWNGEILVGRELGRNIKLVRLDPEKPMAVIFHGKDGDSVVVFPAIKDAVAGLTIYVGVTGPDFGLRDGILRWATVPIVSELKNGVQPLLEEGIPVDDGKLSVIYRSGVVSLDFSKHKRVELVKL